MNTQPESDGQRRKRLAILNHRGEDIANLPDWLKSQGWEVHIANSVNNSKLLLKKEIDIAIIFPLTLKRDGIEWQNISPLLSPKRNIPWLILPWEESAPGAVSSLTTGSTAVADWASTDIEFGDIQARLNNLMRLANMVSITKEHTNKLENQLVTDHKTNLYNDRYFRKRLKEEYERATRHGQPLSLMLLDLDNFKEINDNNSYEFGDLALKTVANAIRQSVRNIDIPARIGGDEFALICPTTTLEEALRITSRIKETLLAAPIVEDKDFVQIFASCGIASTNQIKGRDSKQLFLKANEALKIAKKFGKNRTAFYDPSTQEIICESPTTPTTADKK